MVINCVVKHPCNVQCIVLPLCSQSFHLHTFLYHFTTYRYIKAPRDVVNEEDKAKAIIEKKHKVEENAFGTYASAGGEKFVYRVKKQSAFGGYTVVTESTAGGVKSREELLDMRKKKKSDRFCY